MRRHGGSYHVVLGDAVIEAIDQLVGQRGRGRFLEDAAREKLQRLALDQASINRWVRAQRGAEDAS